jgi:hypothetical protein
MLCMTVKIKSNLYKQSGNTDTDFNTTEPKGDVVIEISGKYDFLSYL